MADREPTPRSVNALGALLQLRAERIVELEQLLADSQRATLETARALRVAEEQNLELRAALEAAQ